MALKKYRAEVTFDRIHPTTRRPEFNCVRFHEGYFTGKDVIKKQLLENLKKNEPTRRKIHKVTVTEIKE